MKIAAKYSMVNVGAQSSKQCDADQRNYRAMLFKILERVCFWPDRACHFVAIMKTVLPLQNVFTSCS